MLFAIRLHPKHANGIARSLPPNLPVTLNSSSNELKPCYAIACGTEALPHVLAQITFSDFSRHQPGNSIIVLSRLEKSYTKRKYVATPRLRHNIWLNQVVHLETNHNTCALELIFTHAVHIWLKLSMSPSRRKSLLAPNSSSFSGGAFCCTNIHQEIGTFIVGGPSYN